MHYTKPVTYLPSAQVRTYIVLVLFTVQRQYIEEHLRYSM